MIVVPPSKTIDFAAVLQTAIELVTPITRAYQPFAWILRSDGASLEFWDQIEHKMNITLVIRRSVGPEQVSCLRQHQMD